MVMETAMKKILAIGAMVLGYSTGALAQSSVTLYGVVDAGLSYINNNAGKVQVAAQDSYLQASRWGLLGSEDLGGGISTSFRLENGFNPYTGLNRAGGGEFGRSAWVGLNSKTWGSITLGRQYDSVADFYQPTVFASTWGPFFSHAGDIDNAMDTYRQSNAIKYASINYGGFRFGALYALGGVAGEFGKLSTLTAGVSYTRGPLYLGAAYDHSSDPVQQFPDGAWTFGGAFSYLGNGATTSPSNKEMFGVGGTYQIGPATVGLNYSHTVFADIQGTTASALFQNYEVWFNYRVTPAVLLGMGDTFTKGSVRYGAIRPQYNQVNAAADYSLSKRTDVYFEMSYEVASGGANAALYGPFTGASSTNKQFAAHVGIRQRF
jgi:predicted porin